jgi:hypothetical protein
LGEPVNVVLVPLLADACGDKQNVDVKLKALIRELEPLDGVNGTVA